VVIRQVYVIEGLSRGLIREKRDEAGVSRYITRRSPELAAKWPGFGQAPSH